MRPVAVLLVVLILPAAVCRGAAAQTGAVSRAQSQHAKTVKTKPVAKPSDKAPLTDRERAVQLLNRFTFGPRPGEVEQVLAMGADNWLEQQLSPETIKDDALNRRLSDYPTL